jgi:hypothetical protein
MAKTVIHEVPFFQSKERLALQTNNSRVHFRIFHGHGFDASGG